MDPVSCLRSVCPHAAAIVEKQPQLSPWPRRQDLWSQRRRVRDHDDRHVERCVAGIQGSLPNRTPPADRSDRLPNDIPVQHHSAAAYPGTKPALGCTTGTARPWHPDYSFVASRRL